MKLLALNSGGFDSVVMINTLREENPDAEIITLFFDYNQKVVKEERKAAKKVAEKIKAEFIEIKLPDFSWCDSSILNGSQLEDTYSNEYLPMRNLIFVSYAMSYAKSRDIKDIYLAGLRDGDYEDSNILFLEKINNLATKCAGINIRTPFIDYFKEDLYNIAFDFSIGREDFCTCYENNDSDCQCRGCEAIKEYFDIENKIEVN